MGLTLGQYNSFCLALLLQSSLYPFSIVSLANGYMAVPAAMGEEEEEDKNEEMEEEEE